ncbi:hypothetical protein NUACC26_043240 [Scytonema sp. NUACC26]
MAVASFRFYAELNDFLPTQKREVSIEHSFTERASIKDMIEALGVPHPEVDCIEVNGKYVDFSYIVRDRDTISVYPISAKSQLSSISTRPQLPSKIRFVLDIHLGKLATSLRLLGFDTLYRNDYADEELARISSTQERILLTRDKPGTACASRTRFINEKHCNTWILREKHRSTAANCGSDATFSVISISIALSKMFAL